MKEISAEYIDELLGMASLGEGDPKHTTFIDLGKIISDLQESGGDVIITTEGISLSITELLYGQTIFSTREICGIEYAEFALLAPRVRRVAVIGTDYCPPGCYIMFTESAPEESVVLWRAGIQA